MNVLLTLAASLVAAASQPAAPAQGVTVADFLLRAQALMMGGRPDPDSPELKFLREQVIAAGKAVRSQQAADREAGRPATFCIPEQADADASELIQHLQKVPPAQRTVAFRDAFADYTKAKYPCPAR